jgi:hypothetical protein
MVLCGPLMAALPVFAGLAQPAVHGAHRAQVGVPLEQPLKHLRGRLIAKGLAVQHRQHACALFCRQGAR